MKGICGARHGNGSRLETQMNLKSINRFSPRALVLILLGFATALKTLWAVTSTGTCDAVLFHFFGEAMVKRSLTWLYTGGTAFNHTPLTGWLMKELYLGTSGDYGHFASALRLACILADIALVLGLLRVRELTGKPPWWALALFAVSPVSIMVSGFHGNLDPIMVMFLFFAAVAVLKDRPVLCGLMYAVACNIKIVPIMVAPIFIFYWITRGQRPAARFMITSGALMLAGAAPGLALCPEGFLRNVFGYGSYWGTWGVTYWLRQTGIHDFQTMGFLYLAPLQYRVILVLKAMTLSGVLALAWRRRNLGGLEFFTTLGAAFTWIFIVMPGAGVQYMVWYAPFVLLLSPRWWTALMACSAIYMARFYHSTSHYHFPWDLSLPQGRQLPYWAPWTNLPWITFIALLFCRGRSWLLIEKRHPAPDLSEPPAAAEPA